MVVGHDIRLSSESLSAALIEGLTRSGVDVSVIGLCGTEEVYFAVAHLGARTRSKQLAAEIISGAIQRSAAEHVVETTVSVVDLPSDDMSWIIGREGRRNIRALEMATGARAFTTMAERVGQRDHQMRALLANVSHDLKTPMTSITGYAHALTDGTAEPDDVIATSARSAKRRSTSMPFSRPPIPG